MTAEAREIFKSSVATLRYDDDYNLVYLTWGGTLTLEKYKEPFLFLLDSFDLPIIGLLSDIRNQSVVGPEMRNWLQKEATPRGYQRGLRYFYVASDMNVFKQYYVNTVLKVLAGDGVDRKLFQDYDKAVRAIKSEITAYKAKSSQALVV